MADPTTDDDNADLRFLASGPGRRGRRRPTPGPVVDLYADGAIDSDCPGCGVKKLSFCRHPDGTLRKTPCTQRPTTRRQEHSHG